MTYSCPIHDRILTPKTVHGGQTYVCPECAGELVNVAVLKHDLHLSESVTAL